MELKSTIGIQPKVYTRDTLDCPIIADVDVVVVGGSQSGVAAAISCARAFEFLKHKGENYGELNSSKEPNSSKNSNSSNNPQSQKKILLLDQNTYLGGQSVTGLVTQWKIPSFRLNVGKWQIKGIGYEMIERIVKMGGSDRFWEDLLSLNGQTDVQWPYLGSDHKIHGEEALNIEAIKYILMQMCEEAGITLLLDTRAVAPISTTQKSPLYTPLKGIGLANLPGSMESEPVLAQAAGVIVEHAAGRGAILAKIVIDASANGLFSWWLGGTPGNEADRDIPPGNWGNRGCRIRPKEKRGLTQSYVWIGGVDMASWTQWVVKQMNDNPELYEFYPNNAAQFQAHVQTGRLVYIKTKKNAVGQPEQMWSEANDQEDLDCLFRSQSPFVGFYAKWCGNYPYHGVFALDGPYYRWESLDGAVWTQEHTLNLHGAWGILRVMRHMPGWNQAYIARNVERMGLRTTRIPNGIYRISGEDVKTHAEKPDAIGVANWHDQSLESDQGIPGEWGYHVPLRSLISNAIDGLLFCGRAVSFEDAAMNAHRGIGTTLVCGQGAGVAAAVCVADSVQPRLVDYQKVQRILKEQHVIFDIPRIT